MKLKCRKCPFVPKSPLGSSSTALAQELNRAVGQVGDDLRKQWSLEQARLSADVTVVLTHGGKIRITRAEYLDWLREGLLSSV